MVEASTPRTLEQLVSALEQKGASALAGFRGRAALIQCDPPDNGKSWGFETRAVTVPWDLRVALALSRSGRVASPELLARAGSVYCVAKRPGGPFPDRIGVGRARSADISLPHASVSKYHAYCTREEPSSPWTLWDARSRNGTTVGEQRLDPGRGAAIANGSSVLFGESAFLFFTDVGFRELVDNLAQGKPGGAPASSR